MINLKESCRKCPGIDACIKVVARNINNMHLPHKKDAIRCINFGYFESAVTEYVMDPMMTELLAPKEDNPMDFTYELFKHSAIKANENAPCIKKIKVSPAFFNYLKAVLDPFGLRTYNIPDVVHCFIGIPVEVDFEIDGHYEFMY